MVLWYPPLAIIVILVPQTSTQPGASYCFTKVLSIIFSTIVQATTSGSKLASRLSMSGTVSLLPSTSPMARYGVSFTFTLHERSSHHHEYRKRCTKPMWMTGMGLKHTNLMLGREKISRCFWSFIAPSYNCFHEAHNTIFKKNFYKTAQFTLCRQ